MQNRKKTTHTRNENKTKQKQKRKQHMQFFPIDTFGMERPSGATGKHAFYRETSGWFVCETSTPKFVQTPKIQKRRILQNRIVISVWAINPRNRVTAKSYHTKYLACHSPEAKVELWLSHAELSNQKKTLDTSQRQNKSFFRCHGSCKDNNQIKTVITRDG